MLGHILKCSLLALALVSSPQLAARAQDRFDELTAIIRANSIDLEPAFDFAIEFSSDSARLSAPAQRQLDRLAALLRNSALAAVRIQIAGHSDSSGSSDHNRRLSARRAAAVKTYLVERHGLPSSRLETKAWGEERPKHPGHPRDPGNRRVEIAVLAPIESLLNLANEATVEAPATSGDRNQIKIEW